MIFPCADIGVRPKSEFNWGGYLSDPAGPTPEAEWFKKVWLTKAEGDMLEWWYHRPSEQWYIGRRDVASESFAYLKPADMALAELKAQEPSA
ncbi:sarcosine oxidase subunit delta [Ponticaulis sp.]|uniref:sarcosine oxidase subunit delta n=1 Tax=Ponticaulis sp. TaxID=2020902 RepID=UPI000B6921D0|nr:sarcosine oxidase subunit delta [Ponticaulis sp.]MAI91593.1 sarcosine oxidase subunit delta [Ponticaulis sp.]OUX97547.1 MAG: hypothetical protein CBB65_14225 [Hyphomonadaceae bacterium TMED5]|tara:strand:- start:62123 stop:62398 length:276 start_codon:yes stop_codon:yes gene_type:complete